MVICPITRRYLAVCARLGAGVVVLCYMCVIQYKWRASPVLNNTVIGHDITI